MPGSRLTLRPLAVADILQPVTSHTRLHPLHTCHIQRVISPLTRYVFFVSSSRRHTRLVSDWSSDVCSSDLGAGVYEETLFRLMLVPTLFGILRLLQMPQVLASSWAVTAAALLFALAHHAGSPGEPFTWYAFIFRWMAGVFFAWVFIIRGFGIAGDLTTTALPDEFRTARAALADWLDDPERVTIVPGNHDRYTMWAHRSRRFEQYFGAFAPRLAYPWLRRIDPHTAILGLDPTRAGISARGKLPRAQ